MLLAVQAMLFPPSPGSACCRRRRQSPQSCWPRVFETGGAAATPAGCGRGAGCWQQLAGNCGREAAGWAGRPAACRSRPSLACRCRRLRNLACVRRHGGPAGGRRRRCRQHPGAFGRDIKRIALPWRPQGGSNALTRRWAPLEGCERGRRGCRPGCSAGRAIRVPGICDRAWAMTREGQSR